MKRRNYRVHRVMFPKNKLLAARNREIHEKRANGQTLQSIGDEYGISRERVRQIHVIYERHKHEK